MGSLVEITGTITQRASLKPSKDICRVFVASVKDTLRGKKKDDAYKLGSTNCIHQMTKQQQNINYVWILIHFMASAIYVSSATSEALLRHIHECSLLSVTCFVTKYPKLSPFYPKFHQPVKPQVNCNLHSFEYRIDHIFIISGLYRRKFKLKLVFNSPTLWSIVALLWLA